MIAFGFVVSFVRTLCAQVQQVWDARYNGTFGGQAYAMVLDSSANVYVTGGANGTNGDYDFATVKYDSNGNQLWVACCAAGPDSEAHAIALDDKRNVYVAGWSRGASNNFDYVTVKYDAGGHELWVARYDGPVSGADLAQALAVDGFGNVYVSGYSLGTTNRGDYDYATVKYDPGGHQLWVMRYDSSAHDDDEASALAMDTAGNVYVTGFSWGPDSKDYATVKYDPNGKELWVKRHPDGNANAIKVDKAGNVYVTGSAFGGSSYDYVTLKYETNGNPIWIAEYDGLAGGWDEARALAVDDAGNVYVTGDSDGDYLTLKYDPTGRQLWVSRYGFSRFDQPSALALDSRGNVYVTGSSDAGSFSGYDYATVKYDADGHQIWVARHQEADGHANAIAIDSAGNVYVTGYLGAEMVALYSTVKYAQGPRLTSPAMQTNGLFQFAFIGEAERNYEIQFSSDLRTWTSLTNFFNVQATNQITDTLSSMRRFYRAVAP